uniref:NADH-ubiquinone oxidoreductase chain 4 n=1 Tax=Haedus sp. TaxID=2931292 RepID=A0A8T9ZYZ1_9HEMI|nr:NADH dehydrogenase subunit 4 [Haedus sp.]
MMSILLGFIFLIPAVFKSFYLLMIWLCFLMILFYLKFVEGFYSYVSYGLGLDFYSWGFILLTFWVIFLMYFSSYYISFSDKSKEFSFVVSFLLIFLFLCFSVSSFFMYYIFFEASLIPTVFLIFGWGYQPERLAAGFYLIFYTLFASLPLLLGIFYMWHKLGLTFFFMINMNFNIYLLFCFIGAFLVKMPMFMFHFWLPKAHVEAPVSGSMILAGVLLKLGGYGLIRVLFFLSNYLYFYNYYFISLCLLGGLICGLICSVQLDLKVLIAYSSVCHMSLCIMGIFCLSTLGVLGSYVLMLAHGLCSSGLFCLVNVIYERSYSRSIFMNKGFIIFCPSLCLFWFLLSSFNMSAPLSLNLYGEVILFISLLGWSVNCTIYLMVGCFLACLYSMYLFSFVNHGEVSSFNLFMKKCLFREYSLIFYHLFPLVIFSLSMT